MKKQRAGTPRPTADSAARLFASACVRDAFFLRIEELTLRELTWPINRMTLGQREDPGSEAFTRIVSRHAPRDGGEAEVPWVWESFGKLVRLASESEIDVSHTTHRRHRCLFPIEIKRLARLARLRSRDVGLDILPASDSRDAKRPRRDLSLLLHYMAGDAPADVNRAREQMARSRAREPTLLGLPVPPDVHSPGG